MKQSKIFIETEANAWFQRNQKVLSTREYSANDPIISIAGEIFQLYDASERSKLKILEIGCGDGRRLKWIRENVGCEVFGIEPSSIAVQEALKNGVNAIVGTADRLPYDEYTFDIVIFGFCLYLCDTEDFFKIASEANRILKKNSWVVIMDFYSTHPLKKKYHHRDGVMTTKMDFRKLFDWHPSYTNYLHRIIHHIHGIYTDDRTEWVSLSCLRKAENADE